MSGKTVSIPNSLAKSFAGKYFVGYADNLTLGQEKNAWAGLFNPVDSGGYLFVNVWTVTNVSAVAPLRAQVWFNSKPPGKPVASKLVTPANKALFPEPRPKVRLLEVSDVAGAPSGGVKAFVRRTEALNTLAFEEEGKYILGPGQNLTVFLSSMDAAAGEVEARVAFGWWEEECYTL